ncbi:MAG: hypothetical protein KGJ60_15865 [Verrucomicrobiota bacterium]|nr:hypothetical protein [Verrucomicrobiota bacterium]
MQRLLIMVANCAWLAVVLIGGPEAAGVHFWHWRISAVATAQSLTLWGLAIAIVADAGAALFLVQGHKERKLCWLWAAVFGALLGVEDALARGWFDFDWLKRSLLWLQKTF